MNEHTHHCPVSGCTVEAVSHDKIMCRAHWRRVPRGKRAAIYFCWNDGRMQSVYLLLRQEAIDMAAEASK